MSGKKEKKQLKQSETVVIKRTQINFAPYNPKKHTKELIQKQLKNFKNIGFLGGIVWNSLTSNLVSGHKRIMAMDIYYGYDGTLGTTYDVKVEKVKLSDKQEKEQNIFMDVASANTKQDLTLLADLLPDIDYEGAGLEMRDIELIMVEAPFTGLQSDNEPAKNDYKELSKEFDKKKQEIKDLKKQIKEQTALKHGEKYVTLNFSSYENKTMFMESFGYNPDDLYVSGEDFFDKINEHK